MTDEILSSIKVEFDGEADDELSDAIKRHIETHENITLIDIVKFLYQSVLGSFHLLDHMSEKEMEAWIQKNLAIAKPEEKSLTEKLYGNTWVRLDLGAFKHKYGDDFKLLARLFISGKEEKRIPTTELATRLDALLKKVVTRKIRALNSNINLSDLAFGFIKDYKKRGFPPIHHSHLYSATNPQYIVVPLRNIRSHLSKTPLADS
ncbi:MAG: hypothetical protein ACLFU9_02200 [Candidatus Bathyarchaeia archaeon]